jgi:hypothetical protein
MSLVAKQALVCWVAALGVIIAALFAFVGAPGSPDGAGEAVGRVFAHTGIAALICWLLARRKAPPWSWGRFALVYLALVVDVWRSSRMPDARTPLKRWRPMLFPLRSARAGNLRRIRRNAGTPLGRAARFLPIIQPRRPIAACSI